jgi:hypothetical protein
MSIQINFRAYKRYGLMLLTVLAVLTLVTVATTASAKAGDRPFKGTMVNIDDDGGFYTDFSIGELQFWLDVEITGVIHAIHIGKGTGDGFATINISDFFLGPVDPEAAPCSRLVEGTIDFTAANGDVLNMVMTENELCGDTGIFTGQYKVLGGTGRFASASGVIDASGMPVQGEPSVTTLTGEIVY